MYLKIKPKISDKILKKIYKYLRKNGVLKKKSKEMVKKKFKDEGITVDNITIIKIGRFAPFDSFLISVQKLKVLFPLIEILSLKNKKGGIIGASDIFHELEWIFPTYLGMGQLVNIATRSLSEKSIIT